MKKVVDPKGTQSSRTERKDAETAAVVAETVTRPSGEGDSVWQRVRAKLRVQFGEEVYSHWFHSLEFEAFDGEKVRASVPVKFLCTWIQSHYQDVILSICKSEYPGAKQFDVVLRQPNAIAPRPPTPPVHPGSGASGEMHPAGASGAGTPLMVRSTAGHSSRPLPGGLEGSPLDPRYTFDSFVVGSTNRMAHAGATQAAETLFSEQRGFNPLYIHASVGLGKSHLLHAIAWEVRRRVPQSNVLYLTAERFRYQFVDALRSSDPLAFKERFRSVDMLLIDDLEFLSGQQTEQEFDHIINWLLDSGRQVVVASARAPKHIEKLNDRMRSRMQRGLVTEIAAPDYDLRLEILKKRMAEKRQTDPSFEISPEVLSLLAERLTESGRELEGAVTRLHAAWQYMHTPITVEFVERAIRDLVQGMEPRRIRIEDILKVISRHFNVPRSEILSKRRHRSVVWPRQIGMYLAKQLTARSLPEIGRRFGDRDHTTVLHAIRKIEGEIGAKPRLREEIEELKKILSA